MHRKITEPTVEALPRKEKRPHYLRVKEARQAREYKAYLTGDQGSGIFLSRVRSHGMAIITEDVDCPPAGTMVPVMMLDGPEDTCKGIA